jgi:hypothetical protein
MANKWEVRPGNIVFYNFQEFFTQGAQVFLEVDIKHLRESWNITKRILKSRSNPRVKEIRQNGKSGHLVCRLPRIHGEESLMKTLSAMNFTSEEAEFL